MLSKNFILLIFLSFCYFSLIAQKNRNSQQPVQFKSNGKAIIALVSGKPVFQYNYKTLNPPQDKPSYYRRSGFIHPAYSPSGDTITEGFPEQHTHHHGIFSAWVHTEFNNREVDFWNQQKQSGTVVFDSVLSIKEGENYGELKTRQLHLAIIEGDTIPVLKEDWIIRVYNSGKPFIWDIKIIQQNIASNDLNINKYHYGGFAVRGRDEWNKPKDAFSDEEYIDFETSQGLSRIQANHTFPEWVSMYGKINNKFMNISVIPRNDENSLQDAVRIHPEMPYFCFTPIINKGIVLSTGETLERSYRIITSNKPIDEKEMQEYLDNF